MGWSLYSSPSLPAGADNLPEDNQRKFRHLVRGEVTAYLSLVFILFITLVGGLMESASIQMAKNYRRADMNRAVECMFAEYQKELLDEYIYLHWTEAMRQGNMSSRT